MSISQDYEVNVSSLSDFERLRYEILSLFQGPQICGKIIISFTHQREVHLLHLHSKQHVTIQLDQNYPHSPPVLLFPNSALPHSLLETEALAGWTSESSLTDLLLEIVQNIESWLYSLDEADKDAKGGGKDCRILEAEKQNKEEIRDKDVKMNGCADNQLTETKNLNRHFRSKLREVYYDLVKICPEIPEHAQWIEASFSYSRVGFEDIANVLKNKWFSGEVQRQMRNGKFMHKIMKGMMSIKSKKLMVKYYHVMLAAAIDPDNFVKWKYQ